MVRFDHAVGTSSVSGIEGVSRHGSATTAYLCERQARAVVDEVLWEHERN